ncbi:plasma membrane calcium-transporting ATPase 4-like protein [Corchorus olitorius]|uniref:Plasma membrane calcium-transporting ATPase 4-like protein n=1 Tax=Corchorus olitorius TaxID=93759 RepID=A0A1R3KJG8_9ROSI|nr:plasma membrane calcium-transporting ATPase 4-like protein [Corchorus olitorius]
MTSSIIGNKTSWAIRLMDAHDSVRSSIPRSNDIRPKYILGFRSFSSGKFRMKVKRSSRLLRLITDRVAHPTIILQTPFKARHRQEIEKKVEST